MNSSDRRGRSPTGLAARWIRGRQALVAAAGRVLDRADDRAGSMAVVVSDRCWRATFGADPSLPGRTIYLNGTAFLVVGVGPPGFQFPAGAEAADV